MRLEKRSLMIGGGFVGLVLIGGIVAALLFNVNSYKPKIETAVSEATGLDVKINGRMGLSFFPLGLSAKNIHITSEGSEILSLEQLKLRAELIPLLKKQLKVTGCDLIKPTITIVRVAEGKYNFEGRERKLTEGSGAAMSLQNVKLSDGALSYLNKETGEKTELKGINLAVNDLSVAEAPGNIIKKLSFTGNFDCKELLQKDVRIDNLRASMKAANGTYNLQPLTIGSLVYFDKKADEKTELKEINLAIKNLSIADTSGDIIKNVSFAGTMDCNELRKKDLKIDGIKSGIKADKGVFFLKPLTVGIFGAKGEGDVVVDKTEADAEYKINLNVSKLDFERLQESFGATRLVSGKGDLTASLTVKEEGGRSLIKGMGGTLSLRGDNLITYTVDLDEVLSTYETSQKFNLVDVGVFFIAGPLGSLALKGYRYGDVYYQSQGGRGTITQFISHWKIENGKADATDCALATLHNRVALKGKLNLVTERYDNVTVALLDDKGCVKFKQSITGSFDSPRVGVVSAIGPLADPVLNLYRQAKRFLQSGKCEVFYNGAVRHQPR